MKKFILPLSFLVLGSITTNAQVGINTTDPGSTLHVNGSLAAQYRSVTTTTYSMNETDYHVAYNGTGNATFTLPAAVTGSGNFKGRLYTIKNNTTSIITVNPSASETIGGNANIALAANQSVQIINTGLTGAAPTWEVIAYNNTSSGGIGCVPDYIFATINGNQEGVTGGTNINFNLTKAGSGIAMTNGVFTLKAGKTYELEVNLLGTNFTSSTAGVLAGNWVDASNNTALASTILEFYPVSYTTTPNNGIPISKAYITAVSDMNVAFRITGSNGSAQIRGNQSYASIKQLNACGGGGGSTPVVTNVTASNGLNASGNDVKLGGTLSQATDIATAGNNLTVSGTGRVGIGTNTPDTSAALEVNSTNKGFLPPKLTLISDTDGVSITNPATGLTIYHFGIPNMEAGLYTNVGTPASPKWIRGGQNINNIEGSKVYKSVYRGRNVAPYDTSIRPNVVVPEMNLMFRFAATSGNTAMRLQVRLIDPPTQSSVRLRLLGHWQGDTPNFHGSWANTLDFTTANYSTWTQFGGDWSGEWGYYYLIYSDEQRTGNNNPWQHAMNLYGIDSYGFYDNNQSKELYSLAAEVF